GKVGREWDGTGVSGRWRRGGRVEQRGRGVKLHAAFPATVPRRSSFGRVIAPLEGYGRAWGTRKQMRHAKRAVNLAMVFAPESRWQPRFHKAFRHSTFVSIEWGRDGPHAAPRRRRSSAFGPVGPRRPRLLGRPRRRSR